jgi:hypothetical protein
MGLFAPTWNSDNKEKRMKAVEKVIAKFFNNLIFFFYIVNNKL